MRAEAHDGFAVIHARLPGSDVWSVRYNDHRSAEKPRVRVVAVENNFDSIHEFSELIERTLAVKGIAPEQIIDIALTQEPVTSVPGRRRLTALIFTGG